MLGSVRMQNNQVASQWVTSCKTRTIVDELRHKDARGGRQLQLGGGFLLSEALALMLRAEKLQAEPKEGGGQCSLRLHTWNRLLSPPRILGGATSDRYSGTL